LINLSSQSLHFLLFKHNIKLPRHYITEILKSELNKNFFTFVNDYRVEEVKSRLVRDEYKNASVLQLGLDSGFNSSNPQYIRLPKIDGISGNQIF